MTLLYKGAHEFTALTAYSASEDAPVVTSEITTAAGYPRRSYAQTARTVLSIALSNADGQTLALDLAQLRGGYGVFKFWSLRDQRYKQGEFLIDITAVPVFAEDGANLVPGEYTATLTQSGAITNA